VTQEETNLKRQNLFKRQTFWGPANLKRRGAIFRL